MNPSTAPNNSDPKLLNISHSRPRELPHYLEALDFTVYGHTDGSYELRATYVETYPLLEKTENRLKSLRYPILEEPTDFIEICKSARERVLRGESLERVCQDMAKQLASKTDEKPATLDNSRI